MRNSPARLSRLCRGSAAVAVRPAAAFYTFDGDTNGVGPADVTGNGRTATTTDAVYGTPAKVGAKSMTGGSAEVAALASPTVGEVWTVAAWMRSTPAVVIGSAAAAANGVITVFGLSTSDVPGNGSFYFVSSGYDVPAGADGVWHHLAVVSDGADFAAYFDGVLLPTSPAVSHAFTGPFTFSATNDDTSPIDEVGVWGVALTPREVARLATGRRPLNVP